MDVSYYAPLQLQENLLSPSLFDELLLDEKSFCDPNFQALDPASDPGYFSACSSLSPTSSIDSCSFSPSTAATTATFSFQAASSSFQAAERELDGVLDQFVFSVPEMVAPLKQEMQEVQIFQSAAPSHITADTSAAAYSKTSTSTTTRKSRSKYPGKKRESASEREKLRMRDLTKALNNLRTYLPPSVAPAGQTLTKIDTLRLAIDYINDLSDQLGLSDEVLAERKKRKRSSSPAKGQQEQSSSLQDFSEILRGHSLGSSYSPQAACYDVMGTVEEACSSHQYSQISPLQHSYPVCNMASYTGPVNQQQYWLPQLNQQHLQ